MPPGVAAGADYVGLIRGRKSISGSTPITENAHTKSPGPGDRRTSLSGPHCTGLPVRDREGLDGFDPRVGICGVFDRAQV